MRAGQCCRARSDSSGVPPLSRARREEDDRERLDWAGEHRHRLWCQVRDLQHEQGDGQHVGTSY